MKKILILIFFVSALSTGFTQPYQSIFGKNNTTWMIEWENLDITSETSFFFLRDTIYNSYTYKIITATDDNTYLLIREDTLYGKVWMVDLSAGCGLPDTTEKLVANMSLSIGDTFNIRSSDIYVQNPADTIIIVDSVYYVQGQKRLRFASPPSSFPTQLTEPITFIEGIGPNYSLLWMANYCSNPYLNKYLLCVYKDSIKADYTNLRFNGQCAIDFSGVKDVPINKIHISPNPAGEYINVTGVQDSKTEGIITNAIGQQFGHYNLLQGTNTISLKGLAKGYYQITFYAKDKRIGWQKFIKMN